MDVFKLEVAQMLKEHPVLQEKEAYKCKYINLLEYFVRKFSPEDKWANATLALYKKALLESPQDYTYEGFTLPEQARIVVATKFKPFKFFSYRYCVIVDCIYMNALNDKEKGEQLYSELSSIYHKRYQKRIRQVFNGLFDSNISLDEYEQIGYLADCWRKNNDFLKEKPIRVIVTATMSAGKSTLLNALVGKKINRTQNVACTAKIHYIKNKAYEDGYCYEQDYILELDANRQTLMDDNPDNASTEINVGAFFRTTNGSTGRLWLIDTPGINSSSNVRHKKIAESYIKDMQAELLIYLLNGKNIGSEDDRKHLQFVLENYKGTVVFVVNKLDTYRKDEDNIAITLSDTARELEDIGFDNPLVVPLSSYAAYLAKMSIWGEELNKFARKDIGLISEMMTDEEYQFDRYYPKELQDNTTVFDSKDDYNLLKHSGILQLEKIIYNLRG